MAKLDPFFVDKKYVLVGYAPESLTELRRDLLLYDGFLDEESRNLIPTMEAFLKGMGPSLSMEQRERIEQQVAARREMHRLDLVRSFKDVGLAEHEDVDLREAIDRSADWYERETRKRVNDAIYRASTRLSASSVSAVPYFLDPKGLQREHDPRFPILRVVLEKFPVPESSVPLQEIITFRRSEESIRRLGSLHVLIARLSRAGVSAREAAEEIEQLLREARAMLHVQQIKYKEGPFAASIRIGEAALDMKIGQLLRELLQRSFGRKKERELGLTLEDAAYLPQELASEWKHVAYLAKAEEYFQGWQAGSKQPCKKPSY